MTMGRIFVGLWMGVVVGCGTQPASLLVNNVQGALDVGVTGTVNPDIDVEVDANIHANVICTIDCDLNTGECDTVCDLAPGIPPTPELLGEALYLANCSSCHGDPVGTGFAPDISGESAQDIVDEFNDPAHVGGAFPSLDMTDIDNLAAYFASL